MYFVIILLLCVFISVDAAFANNPMSLTGKLEGGWGIKREKAKNLVLITHKNVHKFAGFLISKRHVLTSAHNLKDFWLDPVIPFFGDYYVIVGKFNESIPGERHLIEQVECHRLYRAKNPKPTFDIGLITLLRKVAKSDFVYWARPIPAHSYTDIMSKASVIAWDSDMEEGSSSKWTLIRQTEVKFKSRQDCGRRHNENIICTQRVTSEDKFDFSKDAGTPLIGGTSVIGMLSEKWLDNHVIYTSFTECILDELTLMQIPNTRMPREKVPRTRVRYEQNYKERSSK